MSDVVNIQHVFPFKIDEFQSVIVQILVNLHYVINFRKLLLNSVFKSHIFECMEARDKVFFFHVTESVLFRIIQG